MEVADGAGKGSLGRPYPVVSDDTACIELFALQICDPTDAASSESSSMPSDDSSQADGTPQDEYVCVGQIVKVRGKRGEVEVQLLGGTALGLEEPLEVFLEESEGARPKAFTVVGRKRVGKRLALELEGVDGPEVAKRLVGHSVMVNARRLPPLPDGQYYHYQIVGLDVVEEDGASLGRLEEVLETGGNDVYVVRSGENEILIPATDNVVKQVDLKAGRMVVELPPGLVE